MEMKEERKQVHLSVSKAVFRDFMGFIQQKHGYYKKGDIAKWIEIAIRNLLNDNMQQQQSTKNLQKSQKQILRVGKRWRETCVYLKGKFDYEVEVGKILPGKLLEEAMDLIAMIERLIHGKTDS